MTNHATRHPHYQASYITTSASFSVSPFCCLIYELIKCWVHIIRELYFRNGLHSLRSSPDGEANDALLSEWSIEDSFGAKVSRKAHSAAEDTPEVNIFAKDKGSLIELQSMSQRIVDGLVKVLPAGRGRRGVRRVGMK